MPPMRVDALGPLATSTSISLHNRLILLFRILADEHVLLVRPTSNTKVHVLSPMKRAVLYVLLMGYRHAHECE